MKKPITADKSFPRKCNQCAKKAVKVKTISYKAESKHDGRLYQFKIPKLRIMICDSCEEKVFTGEVNDQINAALREHIGLMSPEQIRSGIKRIGMSQKEVAECLGLAEATLSRWINETQIQSRAMDNLLRTFFAFPRARTILSAESRDESFGETEFPPTGAVRKPKDASRGKWDCINGGLVEAWRKAQEQVSDAGFSFWGSSKRQTA